MHTFEKDILFSLEVNEVALGTFLLRDEINRIPCMSQRKRLIQ